MTAGVSEGLGGKVRRGDGHIQGEETLETLEIPIQIDIKKGEGDRELCGQTET